MAAAPSRLRVLFDATAIPASRGGVGRYVESLVPLLGGGNGSSGSGGGGNDDGGSSSNNTGGNSSSSSSVAVVVVCQERDRAVFEAAGVDAVHTIPSWGGRASGRFVWEQVGLPALARRVDARLIHSPHYTFPLLTRRRRVVTIHDLTFFTDSGVHSRVKGLFFRSWIRAARLARVTVVTPSRATAAEFERVTGASPARVFPASLGYDETVFHEPSAADLERFTATLDPVPTGWIAFLGTLEPRKNVSALVRGYAAAVSSLHVDARPALLLSGAPGWDDSVAGTVADARAAGFDVRVLGYLPLDDLRALLGGALLTAYPSLGEGFGLPVLEAMACGSCVLTTDRLSLPEVGGDAVAYCDVDDESIGLAIGRLLADPSERGRLGEAGAQRARRFTWHACADAHLVAYRAAAHPPPRPKAQS